MVHAFIRGRTYYTVIKRRKKLHKPTTRRIAKFKRRIRAKIRRSYYVIRPKRLKRRKSLSESYFRRYIFPKGRPLYKRTISFNANLSVNYQAENTILMRLRRDLKRQEVNKMLNKQWGFKSLFKPLSKRFFSFGRVYLTHRRRNSFITINRVTEDTLNIQERVVFKSSCGLLEYIGPKRSTFHARLSVAKSASSFLAEQQFTSVDIIFPSGIGRVFTRLIRALNEEQIYVRYLIVPKRRAHGLNRKKKIRRL